MKILLSSIGAFGGAILFSVLRTAFYFLNDYQPQMSPMMFILFSPIIGLGFAVVSVPIEWVLSRYWLKSDSAWKAFIVGVSYSTPLAYLIEHWLIILAVLVNPIALRVLFAKRTESSTTAT